MRINKLKPGFEKLTAAKARVIAQLIGDGSLCRSRHDYHIRLEVKDEESRCQFHNDILKVYGLQPKWGTNPSGKTGELSKVVYIRSKLGFEDLLRYADYHSHFSLSLQIYAEIFFT